MVVRAVVGVRLVVERATTVTQVAIVRSCSERVAGLAILCDFSIIFFIFEWYKHYG